MSPVTVICLKKSYNEARASKFETHPDIDAIKDKLDDPNICVLEVLTNNMRRIYLDIEGIPYDQPDMITNIVAKFVAFMKLPSDTYYCLTRNVASEQHNGLSYHVILPYAVDYRMQKKCVIAFGVAHPEYAEYVDPVVYSFNRLFRLPDQGKPTGQCINIEDKHILMKGTLKDSFIQDIESIPVLSTSDLPEVVAVVDEKKVVTGKKPSYRQRIHDLEDGVILEITKLREEVGTLRGMHDEVLQIKSILSLLLKKLSV